jgi:hypothetical protein
MYDATSLIQAIMWFHTIEVVIINKSSFRVSSIHFITTSLCAYFLKAKFVVSNPLFHFGVQSFVQQVVSTKLQCSCSIFEAYV